MREEGLPEPQACVDELLARAAAERVSDVYWLPLAGRLDVRFRKDGIQTHVATLPAVSGGGPRRGDAPGGRSGAAG